jgi:hypothetical protein
MSDSYTRSGTPGVMVHFAEDLAFALHLTHPLEGVPGTPEGMDD